MLNEIPVSTDITLRLLAGATANRLLVDSIGISSFCKSLTTIPKGSRIKRSEKEETAYCG